MLILHQALQVELVNFHLFQQVNSNYLLDLIKGTIHDHYLPCEKAENDEIESPSVITQIFLGGDQLTEECAQNAQNGRADGDTTFERLQGVILKVEDWHACRILYQVCNPINGQYQKVLIIKYVSNYQKVFTTISVSHKRQLQLST